MGLLGWLFGSGKPKRRRSAARRTSSSTRSGSSKRAAEQQRKREQAALDRQAAAWLRTDNRRKQREKAREVTANRRRVRHEMMQAVKTERGYKRQKAALRKEGYSESDIGELLRALGDDTLGERNPQQPRLVLAFDFLSGRGQHARHNPSCATCKRNPTAGEAAETFHGGTGPGFTSGGKVVLGTLERINYRPPSGSSRGGSEWTHEAGDRGLGPFTNRGRGRVLGDPNTGAVTVQMQGSGMKFSPSRGLVG